MEDAVLLAVELNEQIWSRFAADLAELTHEEADWRPVPQANSINLILRHLRIEAEWHLTSIERGAAMPDAAAGELQLQINSVPLDHVQNLKELAELFGRYLAALRHITLATLEERTHRAYGRLAGASELPAHFLGFHQGTHLATHLGQIRAIRNLYCKTHGMPVRFHPNNPTYPR